MKRHLSPAVDWALRGLAIVLMLLGAAMLFVGSSPGFWIGVIAAGIALTAVLETQKRHRHRPAGR